MKKRDLLKIRFSRNRVKTFIPSITWEKSPAPYSTYLGKLSDLRKQKKRLEERQGMQELPCTYEQLGKLK